MGSMPRISVVNKAKTKFGFEAGFVGSLQVFASNYIFPFWQAPCLLEMASKVKKGNWAFVFLDDADQANALGYHEFYRGYPLSKIFVKTTLDDGQSVSVTATHELAEMLVDPSANTSVMGPNGVQYAYEVGDPVENSTFQLANGFTCTNYVLPAWFETHKHPAGTKYDFLGHLKRPFQLEKGGYASVFKNGQWTEIFGSKARRGEPERVERGV